MRAGGLKILNGFKYLIPSELWDYTTRSSCMIFSINCYTGIQGDPDLNRLSFRVSGFCAGGHGSCHFLYAVRRSIHVEVTKILMPSIVTLHIASAALHTQNPLSLFRSLL